MCQGVFAWEKGGNCEDMLRQYSSDCPCEAVIKGLVTVSLGSSCFHQSNKHLGKVFNRGLLIKPVRHIALMKLIFCHNLH